jgi:hypothetical protein
LDAADAKDVPEALLALTVKVYVPAETPVIVIGLLVDEPEKPPVLLNAV